MFSEQEDFLFLFLKELEFQLLSIPTTCMSIVYTEFVVLVVLKYKPHYLALSGIIILVLRCIYLKTTYFAIPPKYEKN